MQWTGGVIYIRTTQVWYSMKTFRVKNLDSFSYYEI
jgi:hypothetical protein